MEDFGLSILNGRSLLEDVAESLNQLPVAK